MMPWTYHGLELDDQAGCAAAPFGWDGTNASLSYIGNDTQRATTHEAARAEFATIAWDNPEAWTEGALASQQRLLKDFYSLGALRLLLVATKVSLEGVSKRHERAALLELAKENKTPICSIDYLKMFAVAVVAVVNGEEPGGAVFAGAQVDADGDGANDGEDDHPRVPDPVPNPPPSDVAALQRLTAELETKLASAASALAASEKIAADRSNADQETLAQSMAKIAKLLANQADGTSSNGAIPAVPRGKVGMAKLFADAKAMLKANQFPAVLKFSRAHIAKIKKDTKDNRGSRCVMIGGGAGIELKIPSDDSFAPATRSYVDGELWNGLSALLKLSTIMVGMPDNDLPRPALMDFFGVWSTIWDSPMGSRAQKLHAFLTFYDKYAGDLGRGSWADSLSRDSMFLLENLQGRNPAICRCCAGTGEEGSGPGCRGSNSRDRPRRPQPQPRGTSSPSKRERGNKMTGLCLSMLDQYTSCGSKTCRHSHACLCGSNCVSAAKCPKWNQKDVDARYGDDIKQMKDARRRRTSKS